MNPVVQSSSIAFASGARIATPDPAMIQVKGQRGCIVVIDATAISATPSVVFNIEGRDPASSKWVSLLASAAVTAVSTTTLRVYPGLTAAANLVASDVLPEMIRIRPVHGDADSITYTVGVTLVP